MRNVEIKRQRAWDTVQHFESKFLDLLNIAEKKYGEKFMVNYWLKLEDIHDKYNYWGIYPKDEATLQSVTMLQNAAAAIRSLTSQLDSHLTRLEDGEEEYKENRKIRVDYSKAKRKPVKKCKCK